MNPHPNNTYPQYKEEKKFTFTMMLVCYTLKQKGRTMKNEELEKTLKSIRGYLSSLSGQLEKRKAEIHAIEGKIDNTRKALREWISTITCAITGNSSENIDKQSKENESKGRWAEWNSVKKSLNPKEVSDAKSDFDRQNLINHALYAFHRHLGNGICIHDAVKYLTYIEESGLYSGAIFSSAIDKADKSLFGGKLRPAMLGKIDYNEKIDNVIENIEREQFWGDLETP